MYEIIFLFVLALIWIAIASYQDLKTTEIANWLSFSLIAFAMGFRFFYSLFSPDANGFLFFYQGLIGLGIFFILENVFYYGRIFAGGDAKIMLALGAILPFSESFLVNVKIFLWFFLSFLFFGAIYGLIWSVYYTLKNFKKFKKEFLIQFKIYRKWNYFLIVLGIIFMFLSWYSEILFILGIFVFILPWFFTYSKAVDEACMIVKISTKNLREGDWLYKSVKVGKNIVKKDWEGLSLSEIKKLQKVKYVWIKKGIPFVPVFFFSLVFLIFLWKTGLWNSFW